MTAADLAARLDATRSGGGWEAKCPAHEDSKPSLSINDGREGVLLTCHAGCPFDAIVAALGLEKRDLFFNSNGNASKLGNIVATYPYTDEAGTALYEVVRYDPKGFRQRRPDGLGGWEWNLQGVRRVLYQLPKVRAAVSAGQRVFICEGEKDVAAVERAGYAATCNSGGAGKWRPEYAEELRGADVVIVTDRDEAGYKHTREVARTLEGIARKVVVVEATDGKDVADHLATGRKINDLLPLTSETLAERIAATTTPSPIPTPAPSNDGFIRVGDLIAEPDNPNPWVVHGLIPSGGMGLAAGKPKAGKSTLARAIALRVCRGEPVLGRETMQGPVLYLGLEDPREATKGHFRRMGARADDDLHVYVSRVPEHAQVWLEEQLKKRDPVLVVIDTMQFFLGIAEINEYGQVVNALRSILDLFRGRRAAVLIVHHAGKGERVGFDAILGSTGILGTVDTAILVKRRPDDQSRTIATMQRMHAPGGEDMPETVLTLDDHTEPMLAGTRADYDLDKMGDAILDYLTRLGDWQESKDVRAEVEGSTKLKGAALDRLFRSGKVARQGEGKKGSPYLFRASGMETPTPKPVSEKPFFVSPTTPRNAKTNPEMAGSADASCTNSFLALPGWGEQDTEPRKASGRSCPKGHAMHHIAGHPPDTGYVCYTCYPAARPEAGGAI